MTTSTNAEYRLILQELQLQIGGYIRKDTYIQHGTQYYLDGVHTSGRGPKAWHVEVRDISSAHDDSNSGTWVWVWRGNGLSYLSIFNLADPDVFIKVKKYLGVK